MTNKPEKMKLPIGNVYIACLLLFLSGVLFGSNCSALRTKPDEIISAFAIGCALLFPPCYPYGNVNRTSRVHSR